LQQQYHGKYLFIA